MARCFIYLFQREVLRALESNSEADCEAHSDDSPEAGTMRVRIERRESFRSF